MIRVNELTCRYTRGCRELWDDDNVSAGTKMRAGQGVSSVEVGAKRHLGRSWIIDDAYNVSIRKLRVGVRGFAEPPKVITCTIA